MAGVILLSRSIRPFESMRGNARTFSEQVLCICKHYCVYDSRCGMSDVPHQLVGLLVAIPHVINIPRNSCGDHSMLTWLNVLCLVTQSLLKWSAVGQQWHLRRKHTSDKMFAWNVKVRSKALAGNVLLEKLEPWRVKWSHQENWLDRKASKDVVVVVDHALLAPNKTVTSSKSYAEPRMCATCSQNTRPHLTSNRHIGTTPLCS